MNIEITIAPWRKLWVAVVIRLGVLAIRVRLVTPGRAFAWIGKAAWWPPLRPDSVGAGTTLEGPPRRGA